MGRGALAAGIVAACFAVQADASFARGCANEDGRIATTSLSALRDSVSCLLNRERSMRGLATLGEGGCLELAAARYAREMRTYEFFGHVAPDGRTFVDRIRRTGYLQSPSWNIGETLAYGNGRSQTPAVLVDALMHSPTHRDVILDPVYAELGVGVADGTPKGQPDGLTIAVEYGSLTWDRDGCSTDPGPSARDRASAASVDRSQSKTSRGRGSRKQRGHGRSRRVSDEQGEVVIDAPDGGTALAVGADSPGVPSDAPVTTSPVPSADDEDHGDHGHGKGHDEDHGHGEGGKHGHD